MALAETLVLTLAPAVAKTLIFIWLKDYRADSVASVIDLLPQLFQQPLQERRLRRQFEAIGERIAEEMLPLFETEGSRLAESSLIAVGHALAQAYDGAKITSELLVAQDLNPKLLYQHIRTHHSGHASLFGEAETSLYDRVLDHSCEAIVDIASRLPTFHERTAAEVLARETLLIEVANETLRLIREIRESSKRDNLEEQSAQFEAEYLLAVKRQLDRLELFGVDVSMASRRQSLSVAYVSLLIKRTDVDGKQPRKLASTRGETSGDEAPETIMRAHAAIAGQKRLLIRGSAVQEKPHCCVGLQFDRHLEHFQTSFRNGTQDFHSLFHFAQSPVNSQHLRISFISLRQ